MFCEKCGKELKQGARFCPRCGMKLDNMDGEKSETAISNPSKQLVRYKKKKLKRIFILIILLALLGGTVYYCLSSSVYQMMKSFVNEDYEDTVDIYNKDVSDSMIQKVVGDFLLKWEMNNILDDYAADEITFDEIYNILSILKTLEDNKLSVLATEKIEELELTNVSKETYGQAEILYEAGDYEVALELYASISEDMPDYVNAQERIAACRTAYKEDVIARTAEPKTDEEFQTALKLVNAALAILINDEELLQRQEELTESYQVRVKEETLAAANEAISSNDYSTALSVLENGIEILSDDSDLTALYVSASGLYEDSITEQVSKMVAENDYEGALNIISGAFKILPDSSVLQALYTETNEKQPVKLSKLKISESDHFYEITGQVVTEDTLGNIYSSGNLFEFSQYYDDESYAKYYLGGNYTTLTFMLAASDINEDMKSGRVVTVYGDEDEILYTSGVIDRTTAPSMVEINVEGVEWIYFQSYGIWWDGVTLLMINPVLYK